MSSLYLRVPMMIVAVSVVGTAQVTPGLRRVSRTFAGEVPLVWTVEGRGALVKGEMRLLDEQGRERIEVVQADLHQMGVGVWQASFAWNPVERLKGLESGRYTAEWRLEWADGRTERTEVAFRLEGEGDGWLSRAYTSSDNGPFAWKIPSQWAQGSTLDVGLKPGSQFKRVRYQVIDERSERVLRAWTELGGEKGTRWALKDEGAWGDRSLVLWMWVEDARGASWVQSFSVLHGRRRAGVASVATKTPAEVLKPRVGESLNPSVKAVLPAAASATPDWMSDLNEPTPPQWKDTNRVATVAAGYVDEERNGARLWPTDNGRPMALSVTGADGMGHPMYGVSYLLSDRATANTALEAVAASAAKVGTNQFPTGAKELSIGRVLAPVVFTAGTIDDGLGKPLAAGFGWASQNNGVTEDAATWSQRAPVAPAVGLTAITQAKAFRKSVLDELTTTAGYTGSEPIALDDSRDGFAVTLMSQDPLERVVLSKSIGSLRRDGVITTLREPNASFVTGFDTGVPAWFKCSAGAALEPSAADPNVLLNPALRRTVVVGGTGKFKNIDDTTGGSTNTTWTEPEDFLAGSATVDLGRAMPGTTGTVSFTATGPLVVEWVLDGGQQVITAGTTSPLSMPVLSVPAQVAVRFRNNRAPLALDVAPVAADYVHLDNLSITVQPPPTGLQVNATELAKPVVAGFTRTQYGTVAIPGQGLCSVTMVTDPDGSAVAEVKDPEGRTVFKIVNPEAKYTNVFKDYLDQPFVPCSPKMRGTGTPAMNAATQQSLLTQYIFDAEGHLRCVIPPLGTKAAKPAASAAQLNGDWGFLVPDTELDATISGLTRAFDKTRALPYATYNAYDGSGHLIASYNPDEGLTTFWVDQKGRNHYSQTEGQRAKGAWTRTFYDQIFRVVAVGETRTAPPADLEAIAVVASDVADSALPGMDLTNAFLSRNLYDTYPAGENDPIAFFTPDAVVANRQPYQNDKLVALLPSKALWESFADGHLVQTYELDPGAAANAPDKRRSIERYYYDQDGRIVIRWVSLKDSQSGWRHFAIGIYYDFAGRVKRLVYPSGPGGEPLQVVYTYDELGRLFSVGTAQDKAYFARYAYHPTGELRAIVYGPGEGFVAKRMLQDPQGWLRTLAVQGR